MEYANFPLTLNVFPWLFPVSEYFICLYSCLRFPHRCDLAPRQYLASLIFLQNWTIKPPLLMASLFLPLHHPWYYLLCIGYIVYMVSWCCHLHIFHGLGCTWSSYCKVDHKVSRSQQCCHPSVSGLALLLLPQVICHQKQLLLETWHEAWVSSNTSNTWISHGNFWWGDQ